MKKSTTLELENFDIQQKSENLLDNSQDIIYQYDTLLYRLQTVINDLDSPLSLVFNDIIDAYYLKIENKKLAINLLGSEIRRFNKIYDITNELNNYYYTEEEFLKEIDSLLTVKKS
jgi:hypothetical protein